MTHQSDSQHETGLKSDSLSTGVAFMMGLTVAQRGVGFIRTALFCRLLPEEELGQWSLVFSFVMFCVPLTLLGITGSFGRYVEHYVQQGQARQFFRRTGLAVFALTILSISGMWICRDWVSWCLFGSSEQSNLLLPGLVTLATTIAYYFFLETLIALRRIRVGSIMELITSWFFAGASILLLHFFDFGSHGVVFCFALANLIGAAFALCAITRIWGQLPDEGQPLPHVGLWRKLAPFAIGLWLVNIVTNVFEMVDRYMIVHFSGLPAFEAQGLVGQYFSSMAVPLLMVGVSTTLAHLTMPYLSKDWEAGRYAAVSDRLNLSVKLTGAMLAFGSTCIVVVAPFLFDVVFGGKYDVGLAVLPWTITFCYWKAIASPIYNYLYCVERTKLMCSALLCGLVANVGLNALLLPVLGVLGAALGTAAGCAVNLVAVLLFSVRFGLRMERGLYWFLFFPLVLSGGPVVAALAFGGLLWLMHRTTWVLGMEERAQLEQVLQGFLGKLQQWTDRREASLS